MDTDTNTIMSKAFYALFAALIIGAVGFALFSKPSEPANAEQAAQRASDLSNKIADLPFTTEDGGTATLSDYQGKPLVVNFFASTCAPCRAELPDFEEVHQEVKEDVTFIGVNHDFQETTWKAFVAETGISFETVFQPNQSLFKELRGGGLPATAFISEDGEVKNFFAGVLDKKSLRNSIDELILEEN